MIKYSAKVFLLSILTVMFTSSKGMDLKRLLNEESVSPKQKRLLNEESVSPKQIGLELKSKVSISRGAFLGWSFWQTYFVKEPIVKYIAECFVKDCSEKIELSGEFPEKEEASGEPSLKARLKAQFMHHLDEKHIKNGVYGLMAEKPMVLKKCKKPIFSIEIDLPTVLLCKYPDGFYYSYRCNNCGDVNGKRKEEFELSNDFKQHVPFCFDEVNKFVKAHSDVFAHSCCVKPEILVRHVSNCHIEFKSK